MFTHTFSTLTRGFAVLFLSVGIFYSTIPQNAQAFRFRESTTPASVSVSNNASAPAFRLVPAGTNNVTANVMNMYATNGAVSLKTLFVKLSQGASTDVVKVSAYMGATKLGDGVFVGATTTALINFTTPILLANNTATVITLKADLSPIGTGQAVSQSGHLIAIDYMDAYGTDAFNTPVLFTGGTTAAGFRVMKSVPTVSLMALPTNAVQDGRLIRFAVSADANGSVGLAQLAFSINQAPLNSLASASLYEFFDSNFSLPVNAQGLLGAFVVYGSGGVNRIAINGVEIPAGQTRYFELRAPVAASASVVTTTLLGDAGYMGASAYNPQTWGAAMAWSPNSTTTSSIFHADWFNAFAVPGLPASGLSFTRTGTVVQAPTCALSASGTRLGKVTLSWTATNASTFTVDPDIGSVATSGSLVAFVSEDTVFTGTATGLGGTTFCSVFVQGPKLSPNRGVTP